MKNSRSRSSASRTSSRQLSRGGRSSHPNISNSNNDDILSIFSSIITSTSSEQWRTKTAALDQLVEDIKSTLELEQFAPREDLEELSMISNSSRFSKSTYKLDVGILQSKGLRALSIPFRTLLSDLRALVVKAACATLTTLSELLQNRLAYLIKDILSTILSIHAQTAKVMHGYAQTAMTTILSNTKHSKPIIGTLLTEIKTNKSKDVRNVSIYYLDVIISNWNKAFFLGTITVNHRGTTTSSTKSTSSAYSEKPLHHMIGAQLLKSILDPSQQVRIQARETFMTTYRRTLPHFFDKLIQDPYGPLSKNSRLKKSILTQAKQEEDLYVFSENDVHSLPSKSSFIESKRSTASPSYLHPTRSSQSQRNKIRTRTRPLTQSTPTRKHNFKSNSPSPNAPSNPFSSTLRSPSPHLPTKTKSRIPVHKIHHQSIRLIQAAVRGMLTRKHVLKMLEDRMEKELAVVDQELQMQFPETYQTLDSPSKTKSKTAEISTGEEEGTSSPEISMLREARKALAQHRYNGSSPENDTAKEPITNRRQSRLGMTAKEMAIRRRTAVEILPLPPSPDAIFAESPNRQTPTSSTPNGSGTVPWRESQAWTPLASSRKRPNLLRQSSIQLQNRLKLSTTPLKPTAPLPSSQEVTSIVNELHSAHQSHLNELTDVLTEERKLAETFDNLLDPKEEDVIRYFEEIAACLDQRIHLGEQLKQSLESISQGG